MTEQTFRVGPIRPPSEAGSLLIQVTRGCTWNKCRFCGLYKDNTFRAYSVESIKNDIDVIADYVERIKPYIDNQGRWDRLGLKGEINKLSPTERESFYVVLNWLMHGGENVFLQDGNSLALKTDRVVEVLQYLRKRLPWIKRITSYARAETLSRISAEDYKRLKEAGLDRIHSGFESGSDEVLELINKGVTSEQEIIAGKNIKESGIEFSVYFMPGVGGKDLSYKNAIETARVVKEIDPDYVRIRTAVIKTDTELWEYVESGIFKLCSENEKLNEIRILIEKTKGCSGILTSDHVVNLLQGLNGRLKEDNERMLNAIDEYFNLPESEQKIFQLARRKLMVTFVKDLKMLSEFQREKLEEITRRITDEDKWNRMLNELLMQYI
ncbi:MAG: radical SAM protein [Clostridiales bacterium]|nr:radical SAM protein [Clostridiales bacterium]